MKRLLIAAALAATSSAAAAQGVTATLTEFKLALSKDTVKAGPVTFSIKNEGTMNHALYVRGPGVEKGTKEVPANSAANLTVTLKPGTYEVFCPLSDGSHKLAGMTKTLVVTAAAEAAPKKKP